MNAQKPSIGRIVHYVGFDSIHYAAIITAVGDNGKVDLIIFGTDTPTRITPAMNVRRDEETLISTWHWPERV